MFGMGGEDFSACAMIGSGSPQKDFAYPHHYPKFGLDEAGFLLGMAMFVYVVNN